MRLRPERGAKEISHRDHRVHRGPETERSTAKTLDVPSKVWRSLIAMQCAELTGTKGHELPNSVFSVTSV